MGHRLQQFLPFGRIIDLGELLRRSDSIKVALRLATKAKPEELARLYRQVKAEDKRFRADE